MKRKNDVLLVRLKTSLLFKSMLFVAILLLLGLSEGIKRVVSVRSGMRIGFVCVGLALLILSLVWDWRHLYLPYRALRSQEEAFLCEKRIDPEQRLPYVYSTAGRELETGLRELLNIQEMTRRGRMQSQYLALQNQINPHFLYNTLDAIRSDALMANEVRIADTIEALSTYFAYTISNMDQYATVSEELGHVQDYFYIQKYRFEDRLELSICGDEQTGLRELCVPRLCLQPLVENAIYHGLEGRGKCGTVTIQLMLTAQHLKIHVSDDGIGMDEKTLNRINERLQHPFEETYREHRKSGGIALDNVNRRVKLLFGEDYGLRLYSIPGKGTDVTMLPKVMREEVNEKRILENCERSAVE